ncbi:sulfotransferase family protein [Actinomadura sediminis]|uniref:Sulfotransferase family protein n=1 Tax=Actinomadura sediminis TaxID=1038904 RepID=A0ABW3EUF7_9ACTN
MARRLARPAFILSTVRSGSTLLRAILDGHSRLHAPHETHLGDIAVEFKSRQVARSMEAFGHSERELRFLLWDALLSERVERSGKKYLVNKSPNDLFIREEIVECWPDARFVFLLRHPGAILRSWQAARPYLEPEDVLGDIVSYAEALESARRELPGLTVRYEELTRDPATVVQGVCEFLEVQWEESMLDYAASGVESFKPGFGDWMGKIRSGVIQPAADAPFGVPDRLKSICAAWEYAV